ncbi:MAG TPA: zf-TFIIB domain-containing protein [Kofleriaceae bacterium]|nr:zf-TFIIB domain-containing protein [Kofleriaceae bacterium]
MDRASPFRVSPAMCPRCRTVELTSGELQHCTSCQGSWVSQLTLGEHVGAMQVDVEPRLLWQETQHRVGLPCAVCKHTMETALLFGVPVDRCHAHGVWFDKDELSEMLRRSAAHVQPAESAALAGLAVLDDTADDVMYVASSGVLEGILDVVGGIFSAIDF